MIKKRLERLNRRSFKMEFTLKEKQKHVKERIIDLKLQLQTNKKKVAFRKIIIACEEVSWRALTSIIGC